MNEFIVWDENLNRFDDNLEGFWSLGCDGTMFYDGIEAPEGKPFFNIGKTDIDGNKIYADCSIFEFEHTFKSYREEKDGQIYLVSRNIPLTEVFRGFFVFNMDMLRYEINIVNSKKFDILPYSEEFRNLKVIGTLQENPELLKEDK